MVKIKLEVQKRTVVGKKVKNLRKDGILPANIYGKNLKSSAVQVNLKKFQEAYHQAGETSLVELKIENEEKTRPVLIHNVQLDPVSDLILHTDFYQVSLTQRIKATIPIVTIGQSPSVANKEGLLLSILTEVEVECLPIDLPEKIEVNINHLTKVDQEIKVSELKVDKSKVTVLTEPNLVVCKIGSLITEEQKKELEAEKAAKAKAEAEKAAAAAPGVAPEAGAPTTTPTATAQAKSAEKPTAKTAAKPEEKKT